MRWFRSKAPITQDPITKNAVEAAQAAWGQAIVMIGLAYTKGEDYTSLAASYIDTLYGYAEGPVLFAPTKAAEKQFRLSREEALSYFVTGNIAEDQGFALQPWSAVRFDNANMLLKPDIALAMGNYYFTDANTQEEAKVEFTFGYMPDTSGALRIHLHHSSFPYTS